MFRKVKKRHSSSSSQSSEISTKSKSVDSSLGGLSRSSTVASLDTDSTKSSGNSTSEACAEFKVKYLGAVEKLDFEMSKTLKEPLDLISYIDEAQQDGKLPFMPGEEEMILGVSKYGVKVASLDQCEVLHRHPLYLIVRMLCYDDGLGAGRHNYRMPSSRSAASGSTSAAMQSKLKPSVKCSQLLLTAFWRLKNPEARLSLQTVQLA